MIVRKQKLLWEKSQVFCRGVEGKRPQNKQKEMWAHQLAFATPPGRYYYLVPLVINFRVRKRSGSLHKGMNELESLLFEF